MVSLHVARQLRSSTEYLEHNYEMLSMIATTAAVSIPVLGSLVWLRMSRYTAVMGDRRRRIHLRRSNPGDCTSRNATPATLRRNLEARQGQALPPMGNYCLDHTMVSASPNRVVTLVNQAPTPVYEYSMNTAEVNSGDVPIGQQDVNIPEVLVATAQRASQFRERTTALLTSVSVKVNRVADTTDLSEAEKAHYVPLAIAKGFVRARKSY